MKLDRRAKQRIFFSRLLELRASNLFTRCGEGVNARKAAASGQPWVEEDMLDAEQCITRGDKLHALGDLPAALASYDAALRRAPRDEEALTSRGHVLMELRRGAEAAQAFAAALMAAMAVHSSNIFCTPLTYCGLIYTHAEHFLPSDRGAGRSFTPAGSTARSPLSLSPTLYKNEEQCK
jgi:tetratricopeptide (TPR) repeat protein